MRRAYTKEQKYEAKKRIEEIGITATSKELSIPISTLKHWKNTSDMNSCLTAGNTDSKANDIEPNTDTPSEPEGNTESNIERFISEFTTLAHRFWLSNVTIGTDNSSTNRVYIDTEGVLYVRDRFSIKWIKTNINLDDWPEIRVDIDDKDERQIMIINPNYYGLSISRNHIFQINDGHVLPGFHSFHHKEQPELKSIFSNNTDWVLKLRRKIWDCGFEDISISDDIHLNNRIVIHEGFVYVREKYGIKRVKTSINVNNIIDITTDDDLKVIYVICNDYSGLRIDKYEIYYLCNGEVSGYGTIVEHFGESYNGYVNTISQWTRSVCLKYKDKLQKYLENNPSIINEEFENDYVFFQKMGFTDSDYPELNDWFKEENYFTCQAENIIMSRMLLRDIGISDISLHEIVNCWPDLLGFEIEKLVNTLIPYRNNLKLFIEKYCDADYLIEYFHDSLTFYY